MSIDLSPVGFRQQARKTNSSPASRNGMADQNLRVLITGSAGFIGFHTASRLLQQGATVLGIDNFSDYYDVSLKEQRNKILENYPNFKIARVSIEDSRAMGDAWSGFGPDIVIHLAAQAGDPE